MKNFFLALLALTWFSSVGRAEPMHAPMPVPLWGAQLQGLSMADDFRSLDVAVPLPALPHMPKLSYHRHAYESENRFSGAWHSGGAHSVKAHLPFGLTFETGRRLDRFGHDDAFVGLTFSYTHLRDHHENWHYGRLGADRGAPIPEDLRKGESGGRFWKIAGSVALVAALAGGGGGSTSAGNGDDDGDDNGADSGWNMVWNDEFTGAALDVSKWSMLDSYGRDQCFGGGNNEQQCYTDSAQNISLSDGKLILTARQASGLAQGRTYTSGRVQSNGKGDFTYGKFEARIKLPSGQGSWPAFWMLPSDRTYGEWPRSGEIDIIESVNLGVNGESTVHGTIHYGAPHNYTGGETELLDINAFHTYTVEWYPDEMRWFIDGTQYSRKTSDQWFSSGASGDANAPFDQDFHLILNLAIGGQWPRDSDGQNFPRQMEVEYVRVYECADGPSACKQ